MREIEQDLAHVAWAVNLGCLGFHVWPSLAADPGRTLTGAEQERWLRINYQAHAPLEIEPATDSATATWAARATSSLVTDASAKGWAVSPWLSRAATSLSSTAVKILSVMKPDTVPREQRAALERGPHRGRRRSLLVCGGHCKKAARAQVDSDAVPERPLYLNGARMLHYHPLSVVTHGLGLNITVQSYCDTLDFGLISCARLRISSRLAWCCASSSSSREMRR